MWGEALLVCFEQLLERESSPNAACASNGFSWIFYPAQVACQTLAAPALLSTRHILDKRPVPDTTTRAALLVNADNANHIGVDRGEVEPSRLAGLNLGELSRAGHA